MRIQKKKKRLAQLKWLGNGNPMRNDTDLKWNKLHNAEETVKRAIFERYRRVGQDKVENKSIIADKTELGLIKAGKVDAKPLDLINKSLVSLYQVDMSTEQVWKMLDESQVYNGYRIGLCLNIYNASYVKWATNLMDMLDRKLERGNEIPIENEGGRAILEDL